MEEARTSETEITSQTSASDLGATLLEHELLDQEQLDQARAHAAENDVDLADAILELNLISHARLHALAFERFADLAESDVRPPADAPEDVVDEWLGTCLVEKGLLSEDQLQTANRYRKDHRANLRQAIIELNLLHRDWLHSLAFGRLVQLASGGPAPTRTAAWPVSLRPDRSQLERDLRVELREIAATATPTDILYQIVARAFDSRATDIHIDSQHQRYRVRFRIDGILHDVLHLDEVTGRTVISRIKVASELNIVERRQAQDGQLTLTYGNRPRTLRVASLPTAYGEKIVLRILESLTIVQQFPQLGLTTKQAEQLGRLVTRPYGAILVAGPVGSGKTTTLYSCLTRVNDPGRNVMTIEDPIEFHLPGANQAQIDNQVGFTFAAGLRGILRQDPNVLMIGEIRDEETARIGIRAALTGVLVFSTIHAADAASAATALHNFGIPGYTISAGLIGVVSQRLVRTICPYCVVPYRPSEAEILSLAALGYKPDPEADLWLFKGRGCRACFDSGYLGRIGVFEVLPVSELIRELLLTQSTREVVRTVAIDEGMRTIRKCAVDRVLDGTTSLEEAIRIAP